MTGDVKPIAPRRIPRAHRQGAQRSWASTASARCSSSLAHRWCISPACNGGAASASPPPSCRATATSPSSRRISKNPRCARASSSRRSARVERGRGSARHRRRHPARPQGHGARSAIEETVRFFAVDGLHARDAATCEIRERRAGGARLPHDQVAPPNSRSCRRPPTSPSPPIATSAPRIERGMTPADIGAMMNARARSARRHARIRADPARRSQRLSTWLGQAAGGARRRSRAHGLRLHASRATSPTSRAPSCSARRRPSSARCGSRCATASRSRSKPRASACPPARSTTRCARNTRNGATARATSCPASRIAPATASASTATSP